MFQTIRLASSCSTRRASRLPSVGSWSRAYVDQPDVPGCKLMVAWGVSDDSRLLVQLARSGGVWGGHWFEGRVGEASPRVLMAREAISAAASRKMLPASSARWKPEVRASDAEAWAASRWRAREVAIAEKIAIPSAPPSQVDALISAAARPALSAGTPALRGRGARRRIPRRGRTP